MALHLNPNSSMINIMNPGNPRGDSFAPTRVGDIVDRNSALSDMNPAAQPEAFKNQLSANFPEISAAKGKKEEAAQAQAASALASAALSPAALIQATPVNALIPDVTAREAIAHDLSAMAVAAQAERDSIAQDIEAPNPNAVASLEDLLIKEIDQGANLKQLAATAKAAVQGKASSDKLTEGAAAAVAAHAEPDSMQAWLAQSRQDGTFDAKGAVLSHRPVSGSTMQHLSGADFLQTLAKGKSPQDRQGNASGPEISDSQAAIAGIGLDRAAAGLEKVHGRDPVQRVELDTSGLTPIPGQNYSTASSAPVSHAPQSVTGNVTLGAMAQNRLTNESIQALGASLQHINVNGRDSGTVRIRLNPNDMGEIYLKVQTSGDRVGLQVHAADDNARKILEASLGDLRDQLASRNLHLAAVDIQTALPAGGASGSHDFGAELQQQNQHNGQNLSRQAMQDAWDGRQSGQRNDSRNWNLGTEGRIARPLASAPASRLSQAAAGAGRVDLFA